MRAGGVWLVSLPAFSFLAATAVIVFWCYSLLRGLIDAAKVLIILLLPLHLRPKSPRAIIYPRECVRIWCRLSPLSLSLALPMRGFTSPAAVVVAAAAATLRNGCAMTGASSNPLHRVHIRLRAARFGGNLRQAVATTTNVPPPGRVSLSVMSKLKITGCRHCAYSPLVHACRVRGRPCSLARYLAVFTTYCS